ncbi:MAG: TIGR03643 family protein [Chitinophagales bacterium]
MNIIKKYNLSELQIDRIINMAWEDRTPFEAITFQFGLSENEVIRLMKQEMRLKNWQKWRSRVQGRKTKHRKLRSKTINRFRSKAQKAITGNLISKKKYK